MAKTVQPIVEKLAPSIEDEYKALSDKAIKLHSQGKKLSPEEDERYQQVKHEMSKKAFDFDKFKAENEFPVGVFTENYKDWDSVKAFFDEVSPESTNDLLKYIAQRWNQVKLDRGK